MTKLKNPARGNNTPLSEISTALAMEPAMTKTTAAKRNPIRAIRRHCLDCCGGSAAAVAECPAAPCALWVFRMGENPFRAQATEKQKAQALKNLRAARAVRNAG